MLIPRSERIIIMKVTPKNIGLFNCLLFMTYSLSTVLIIEFVFQNGEQFLVKVLSKTKYMFTSFYNRIAFLGKKKEAAI